MLMGQGITIPNRKYYNKGMKSEAYLYGDTVRFTRAELKKIFEGMTTREREFANLAHRYFNEVSKKAINETSMTLEGIETAQVDNYFPLQSDPNKLRQGKDVKAMQEALSNIDVTSKGFLKERKNARNAIILDDVTNILLNQIEAVSEYYGFAVAHRNFEAILAQVVDMGAQDNAQRKYKEYNGKKPVQSERAELENVNVLDKYVKEAENNIAKANSTGRFAAFMHSVYDIVFKEKLQGKPISIKGVTIDGKTYDVNVVKSSINKIFSKNSNADRIAVINQLDEIIRNAKYMGSGEYDQHSTKDRRNDIVRYDYFETNAIIGGKPKMVKFDVTVYKDGQNNYKTHRIIEKIDLGDTDISVPSSSEGAAGENLNPTNNVPQNDTKGNGETYTLEEVINKKWGKEATRYIEKLLQDNIGLNRSERSIWGAMQGKFASAVLGLNPSVAIKQLSAYPTAGDVVGQKALVKGLLRDATFTPKQVRELDATIDKYTPMLAIRREGTGIREVGDVLKNNPQWAQKVPHLMQLPGLVDTAVVRKLWGACECYVEDTLGLYKERNESKSYIERAVDEAAKNRAQSAGDNGRHLTDSDLEGYLKTGTKKTVRDSKNKAVNNGEKVILENYNEVKEYVNEIVNSKNIDNVPNKAVGIVGNKLADMVYENNPNMNIYGSYIEIVPSYNKHGFNEHIGAKHADDRALTTAEISDIIYNLNDRAIEVIRTQERSDGSKNIFFGIETKKGYSVMVAVVSGRRFSIFPRTIWGNTAKSYENYKKEAKQKQGSPSDRELNFPARAMPRPNGFSPAENSIAENDVKDNPNLQTNKKTTSQRVPVGGVFHPRSTHTVNSSSDNTVPQNDTKGNKKYVPQDEYYRQVAKAFEQCIFRTQQNYTPMQQSQILRDTRTSTKLLTLFSSQNNQNYNVLYEAVGRYRAYKEKYGKGSAEFARAKAQLGRAVVSQILQGATFAGLGVFVKGFIKGAYDDKDEAAQDFFSQLISAFAGTVYGGQELYDLIMSAVNGEEWEGINVASFSTIKKLGQNIVDLVGAIADIDSSGFTNNNVLQAVRSVSKTVAGLFGVPAENAEAYIKDIVGRVTESASGGEFSFEEWYDGLFYRGTAARVKKASGVKRDTAIDDAIYDGMNSVYGKSGGDEIKRLTQIFADEDGYNISDIYARSAPDRVTYNSRDYILTGSEKDRWLRTQNKAFGELNEFVKSEEYKALSDDEKFRAVSVFAKSAKATADAELAKARKRELLASDNAEDRAQGKKIEISDEYTRLKEKGGSLADYAVYEAKVYGGKADYSADKEGYSQKEKKEILFEMDISEESMAAIYSVVFEDKNTKEEDSVLYAVKQGISAQTFVGFTSQEFEGEDKTGQKRKWLLDNCRDDKELKGMYERFMESEDTEEYKTIGYAAAQGVSPRKFVEFKQAVAEAKGSAGEAKTYSYWRNGKVVTEQYTGTESGSKAQEIYGELLGGGYSDKEIEVLYSMQFSDKIYPYAMEMGISAREYVKFKQAYANIPKGKGKKQRVFEAIESLKLSADKKMLLFCAQGYSPGTENKMRMFRYIDSLNLSREQKMILADIMGFRVENGRVYVS